MPCSSISPPAAAIQPACRAHHLEDEHLGRGPCHRAHVERRLERRHRDVLGDRAEARAAVRDRQVVVDRLRHVDRLQRIAHRLRQLADLEARVGRVAAAVVEEPGDVVGAEDLDQPLVLAPVLVERLQLVAARAERAGGRRPQGADRRRRLLAGVDQLLGERADDSVPARVDVGDDVAVRARRLDDAARRGVDDGGDSARLGVERVLPCFRSGHARLILPRVRARRSRRYRSRASAPPRRERSPPAPRSDTARRAGSSDRARARSAKPGAD